MWHVHIIDAHVRRRAAVCRAVLGSKVHAEIYGSLAEFCESKRTEGVLLVADAQASAVLEKFEAGSLALPCVVYGENPKIDEVVHTIQSGALDYIRWPASVDRLTGMFEKVRRKHQRRSVQLHKRTLARERTDTLSERERQVLILVAAGGSNKSVAETLGLSPRTVEIHRGNVMRKLEVTSVAEAVKITIYAGLDPDIMLD